MGVFDTERDPIFDIDIGEDELDMEARRDAQKATKEAQKKITLVTQAKQLIDAANPLNWTIDQTKKIIKDNPPQTIEQEINAKTLLKSKEEHQKQIIDKQFQKLGLKEKAQKEDPQTSFLQYFEGFNPTIYKDSKGHLSIGTGIKIDDPIAKAFLPEEVLTGQRPITEQENAQFLKRRLNIATDDAKKFIGSDVYNKIPEAGKIVLTDMSYNLGLSRLSGFKNMKAALEQGDFKTAAKEMYNSNWYKDVGPRRAKPLIQMMWELGVMPGPLKTEKPSAEQKKTLAEKTALALKDPLFTKPIKETLKTAKPYMPLVGEKYEQGIRNFRKKLFGVESFKDVMEEAPLDLFQITTLPPFPQIKELRQKEQEFQRSLVGTVADIYTRPDVWISILAQEIPRFKALSDSQRVNKALDKIIDERIPAILKRQGIEPEQWATEMAGKGVTRTDFKAYLAHLKDPKTGISLLDRLRQGVTYVYGGGPSTKQIADIAKRFNLSQAQIENISKGIYTGLPAQAISEIQKLSTPSKGEKIISTGVKSITEKSSKEEFDTFADKLIAENDKLQVGDEIWENGIKQGTVASVSGKKRGKGFIVVESAITPGEIISGRLKTFSMLEGDNIQVIRPSSPSKVEKINEEHLKSIIEKQGAQYKGIQESFKGEDIVLFNDPKTKSTLALPISQVTPENVRGKLSVTPIPSPQAIVDFKMGYLGEKDNIGEMIKQYGNFTVVVKDVNGNRARFSASDFLKLSKNKAFTDRIKEVWIASEGGAYNPKTSKIEGWKVSKAISKPDIQEGFMQGLQTKKLLEEPKELPKPQQLEDVSGIILTLNSTILPQQVAPFREALLNNNIRRALKQYGVKELIIEPPYKFGLSEQANIDVKKGVLKINADATNPTNTIFHELGHKAFEDMPKNVQNLLINEIKNSTHPDIQGYLKINKPKEALAELLFKEPRLLQMFSATGERLQPPKAELPYKEIEPMTGGKPTEFGGEELTPEEIKRINEERAEEEKIMKEIGVDYKKQLTNAIIKEGKIKPHLEEDELIPPHLIDRKSGRPLDDLVNSLKSYGLHFESEDELRQAIFDIVGQKERIGKKPLTMEETFRQFQKVKGPKKKKVKPEETSVGTGGVLNTRYDTDYSKKREITKDMPFALLGNKSEVIARLSGALKGQLTKGIKKVYDLFGGAKGYRIGLLKDKPAADYNLNELSDERNAYYTNIKDPEKMKIMIKKVADLKENLFSTIVDQLGIDRLKYTTKTLADALNKALAKGETLGHKYDFLRGIVQQYGDDLLKKASLDNFQSPESSAIYYFLENTSIMGIQKTEKGYKWGQGILRTTAGKAEVRESITRIQEAPQRIAKEHQRDKNMPITKKDGWRMMNSIINDINAGNLKPEETLVLVDPQYLNPTAEAGTYAVGGVDAQWQGHQWNLNHYLLPLIETGAKIIYTNNLDPNLEKWLKDNRIPYNIELEVGKTGGKGGRDEIISFINYKLPKRFTSGAPVSPGGPESTEDIFRESPTFEAYLRARQIDLRNIPTNKQKEMARILARQKGLSVGQLRRIAEAMTGKKTMKTPMTPSEKIKWERRGKKPMTKKEADQVIRSLQGIVKGERRTTIPKKTTLAPGPKAGKYAINHLRAAIRTADLGFDEIDTYLAIKNIGLRHKIDLDNITEGQAQEFLKEVRDLKKLPKGERIDKLFEKGKYEFKNKGLDELYKRIKKYDATRRGREFDNFNKKISKGEDWHTPLYQSLKIKKIHTFKDVRLTLGQKEVNSGIPLYQSYLDISKGASNHATEYAEVKAGLIKDLKTPLTQKEELRIEQYYDAIDKGIVRPELSPKEEIVVRNIRETLDKYKTFIRSYRFYQWLETKYKFDNKGKGITDMKDVDQDTLEEGALIYEKYGPEELDRWLKKQTFGTIEVNYIPRAFLRGPVKVPYYKMGAFTHKRMKTREAHLDFSNIPLMARVNKYFNEILNLKHLEKPVKEFDEMINAVGRENVPTKTIDLLMSWIDTVKGHRAIPEPLDQFVRAWFARPFYRVITLNPFLWYRNLWQRGITPPHKSPIFSPVVNMSTFKGLKVRAPFSSNEIQKLKDKLMSKEEQEYFNTYVAQMEDILKRFLLFLGKERTNIPGADKYIEWAENIGKTYAVTDDSNRLSVFIKSLRYYEHYLNKWIKGEIPRDIFLYRTPFKLMRTYEQTDFLKKLDQDPVEAVRWAAKWNSDNSQWLYKVGERSLSEMKTTMRSFYNLLVWGRGYMQNIGSSAYKAFRGRTHGEKWAGLVAVVSTVLGGYLAEEVNKKVFHRKYFGYNPLQSLLWVPGGPVMGQLAGTMDAISYAVYVYTSNQSEYKKKKAINEVLSAIDTSPKMFLPFYKNAINIFEAVTDTAYVAPINQAITGKGPKEVNRTMYEKMIHGIFGGVNEAEGYLGGLSDTLDFDTGTDLDIDLDTDLDIEL